MSTRKALPEWVNKLPHHLSIPFRYVSFGDVIKRSRKAVGLSQSKLAKRANISRNYVSLLERGQRANLSLMIFLRLARALDVDEHELLSAYILLEKTMVVSKDEHNSNS